MQHPLRAGLHGHARPLVFLVIVLFVTESDAFFLQLFPTLAVNVSGMHRAVVYRNSVLRLLKSPSEK